MSLYRILKYGGLRDSLDTSSREMINLLNNYNGEGKDQAKKISDEIGMKYRTFLQKSTDSRSQINLIQILRKAFQFAILQDELKSLPQMAVIQQTVNNALMWNNYNPEMMQNGMPNVSVIPSQNGDPDWVKIIGLNLNGSKNVYENPFSKTLKNQLGNWVLMKDGELFIRGTKQSWEKFINIAKWYLGSIELLNNLQIIKNLPSEKDFIENKSTGQKKIIVKSENDTISVLFDIKESYYYEDIGNIVDYIDKVLELPISTYRIYWENGLLQFIAPTNQSKKSEIASKLYTLSNKLKDPQGFNYQSIDLNAAIKKVYGVSMKESQEDERSRKKSEKISDKVISSNLRKNLLSEPFTASRFSHIEGDIEEKIKFAYKSNVKFDKDAPYGPNNWAGLFSNETTAAQNQMQIAGVKFLTSRKVSILADEPGTGKTAQALVAADIVRENNQKILVFTPNALLNENWFGEKAKGPMFFCGHSKDQLINVTNKSELDAAIKDPKIIWIIIKNSTFEQTKSEGEELANAINKYSQQSVFASLIIDEIQEFKDPESSKSYARMQQAINWDGIPFRIGLSGTPADNTPVDIFSQLRLLRHDVIRDSKGEKGGYAQNEEGFAAQFLGGAELSKIVALSRRRISDDKGQEVSDDWKDKCYSVLEWTQNLTPAAKENIARLFSETFLRREKSDIKDIPLNDSNIITVKNVPQIPNEITTGKDWKSKTAKFNAMAKTSATAEQAVKLLKEDPTRQIFIGTQFIDSANEIANKINKIYGDGTAFAIHGDIKDLNKRDYLVKTFRSFGKANGYPKSESVYDKPIRVLVYTLDTGAVGLNFSNCDTGILNDLDDNPSVNLQAQYRVHRIDSKKPVSIYFTQFDDSVGSAAANYDRSCFKRIQQKKKINSEICKLIKKVQNAKNPKDKIHLTNEFVVNTIENIIIDIGFDEHTKDFFFDNVQKAINGQPIDPLASIDVAKKKDEFLDEGYTLFPFVPKEHADKFHLAKSMQDLDSAIDEIKIWLHETEKNIASITGKHLDDLDSDEIKSSIEKINDPSFKNKAMINKLWDTYQKEQSKFKLPATKEDFKDWLEDKHPNIKLSDTSNWYRKITAKEV